MIFIESPMFTRLLPDYLDDDEYGKLQHALIEQPEAGDLIQSTGGLRKLRWRTINKGKRGGLRIIYYWQNTEDKIYFLTLYAKNEITDLSSKEKKALRQLIEDWI